MNDKDGDEMKIVPGARRVMTAREIAVRVNELVPRFLEGFTPSEVAAILEAATLQRFPARLIIAAEGHGASKLYLFLKGAGRAFTTTLKGEKVVLLWIRPGEISGGRALLFKSTKYLVSTETVTESLALVWNRKAILSLAKEYPRLVENTLMIASDYVESCRDLHVAAIYDSAGQRLARVLEALAEGIGEKGTEGTAIHISNEELANEANVTIFTVSRLLCQWQRKGFLEKGRGRVMVRLPEELMCKVG